MNTRNSGALVSLVVVAGVASGCTSFGQAFHALLHFSATEPASGTNTGGANPYCAVICSGNVLYGTTKLGGSSGHGTVFALNTDGTGFRTLHDFSALLSFTNNDGAYPQAGLVLMGNTLYGTAAGGGDFNNGTVFALNTYGTSFTNLHSFSAVSNSPPFGNVDGSMPLGGLCLAGQTLVGAARQGGASGSGAVFALNTDGTGFTNLHSFSPIYYSAALATPTNSDGVHPNAGLAASGSTLYGTAANGGDSGSGTVFALNTDGTGFTNLHSFSPINAYTNADGQTPSANLVLCGSRLYGTTVNGGLHSWGTIFALDTSGAGFTNLHSFSEILTNTNADGANPQAGLLVVGSTLYGTTILGGEGGHGTLYALDTQSAGFATLYAFAEGVGGYFSAGGLAVSNDALYGALAYGGEFGNGTVFSLSFRPKLTIGSVPRAVVLTWPTNGMGFDYSGYRLESSATVGQSAVWQTNSRIPVATSGYYTFTNPIDSPQQYFRLRK